MDNLELEIREDVAVVWLDRPGEAVNTLSPAVLRDFEEALGRIEQDGAVRAAVFISRKPDSFIVGADLRVLQTVTERREVEALSRDGHRLLRRVRDLGKPVVAAIHGPALGGGLEVALACTYRLATDHPKTRFGLPEVRLGLLPGGGGTQLLPRLVGLQRALDLMLTGRNVYPKQARRLGLVDALIHPPGLLDAALSAARRLADGTLHSREAGPPNLAERLLEHNALTRRLVYQQAETRVLKETMGNYPAPLRILDVVRTGMEEGLDAGLEAEARHFADLVFSPEARQLIFLFFAQQAAKKNPWPDEVRPVRRLGIVGAGLMGSGVAEVSTDQGLDVLLKDQDLRLAARGKQKVWQGLSRKVRKGALSAFERDAAVERVVPATDYAPFAGADLVVEAAPEDLALKRQILADVEAVSRTNCVFASNTSSIPITDIAEGSKRPEAVIGMHYFSPVPQMPLLEIIRTPHNPPWVLGTAYDVGLRQGKTVIVVNDGPGFYTTRVLAAYQNEALRLLREGARIEDVDRAMKQFGFPMGPFALFDLVGIDVAARITDVLGGFFAERGLAPDSAAGEIARAGFKGQKSGLGFYRYEAGRSGRSKPAGVHEALYAFFGDEPRRSIDAAVIQDRLALVFVNEAVRCLDDGILASAQDGDVGAVFGLGFPPFRGGPFRYVDAETAPAVFARLERLALQHGPSYQPAPSLRERARTGERFYD